jgi:Fur family ferric uptake transcriptional regulator
VTFAAICSPPYYVQVIPMSSSGPHILPSLPKKPIQPRESAPYEPVCAIFRRYLHEQKLKFTPERAMMLDAVLRKQGLFEPEGLVDDLKKLGHRVSRATVYRTLAHLQDAGILKQVFFDNRQSYYEVIAGRQAYDYLICVATGRVIEFASEKLRKLRDEICREHGFDPLSHQFHVYGVSPEGKAKPVAAPAPSESAAAAAAPKPPVSKSPFSK